MNLPVVEISTPLGAVRCVYAGKDIAGLEGRGVGPSGWPVAVVGGKDRHNALRSRTVVKANT
jgi:hypothetical protein